MVQVRSSTLADIPALGRVMAVSFRSAFESFVSRETLDACAVEESCAKLLGALLQAGQMHFLTGLVDGKVSGLLVWHEVEIEAIHSLPESWGSGLGAAMLAAALEKMPRPACLWAFERNARARRFYEKHGFRFTGEKRVSEFDGAVEVRYALR